MNAIFDHDRARRIGMPEVVFCEGKDDASLAAQLAALAVRTDHPTLLTRLAREQFRRLDAALVATLDYDEVSATALLHGTLPARAGRVAVVAAGTSDLKVSREAARTLAYLGVRATEMTDVGVAGLWRLLDRIDEIRTHDVVIVVAGMDAALASVMGGLVGCCVIGVPTSVGYGVAAGGTTALNAMLASCGQGVVVTNIDNGFGAACAAVRILNTFRPLPPTR